MRNAVNRAVEELNLKNTGVDVNVDLKTWVNNTTGNSGYFKKYTEKAEVKRVIRREIKKNRELKGLSEDISDSAKAPRLF